MVSPECNLLEAFDGFGNKIHYGSISSCHDALRIVSEGVVQSERYAIPDASPNDIYLFPTPMTRCNAEMLAMARGLKQKSDIKTIELIMHVVHEYLCYERFVTNNTTTAESAFSIRRGVCQDFAHVMIALCKAVGFHARYVAGLVVGEGETHAWVEVNVPNNQMTNVPNDQSPKRPNDQVWLGFDPTHDKVITSGYIKLAHGRDAADCPVNRGRFYQWTSEIMTVNGVVDLY